MLQQHGQQPCAQHEKRQPQPFGQIMRIVPVPGSQHTGSKSHKQFRNRETNDQQSHQLQPLHEALEQRRYLVGGLIWQQVAGPPNNFQGRAFRKQRQRFQAMHGR